MQVSLKSLLTTTIIGLTLLTSTNNTCFGADTEVDNAVLDPDMPIVFYDISKITLGQNRYATASEKTTAVSTSGSDDENTPPAPCKPSRLKALHQAIINNQVEFVKKLIASNPAIVNRIDDDGYNALHIAAVNGSADIIQIIAKHIDNIAAPDASGMEAIHLACINGKYDTAVKLLGAGASIDARTRGLHIKPLALALHAEETRIQLYMSNEMDLNDAPKAELEHDIRSVQKIIRLITDMRAIATGTYFR